MGQITSITEQKKNKKRVNLFIDGEYCCSLDKMTAFTFGIKEGIEIDATRLQEVIADSEQKSAFDKAVSYLCRRMRTEVELNRYLVEKGYTELTVKATIQKLKEYKYVNDEDFARTYIKTYRQKCGSKKLFYDLVRLGVEESIINDLLEACEDSEYSACRSLAEKYIRTHTKNIAYQKLATYLYGKGFDAETAKSVAKEVCSTQNQGE